MKQKKLSRIFGFFCIIFVLFYFINKGDKLSVSEIDTKNIRDFDIILSKGQSVQSKLIGLLKFSAEDYSHIGILIKNDNKVFVLHSTPDGTKTNGIRYDNLQLFINLSDVYDYSILRYKKISYDDRQSLTREFNKYKIKKAPFDFVFNNFDNRKIYCSELVWLIFKNSGLFDLSDFNLSKPIYPKYFLMNNKLTIVSLHP